MMKLLGMKLVRFGFHTAVSLLGAALLVLSFLFAGWNWLCFVALVPWAILYGRPGSRAGFLSAAIGGIALLCAIDHPLLKWGPLVAFLLVVQAVIHYGTGLMVLRASGRWLPSVPIALRLPVLWVTVEWIYLRIDIFRLPIYLVSHPLVEWPVLIQVVDLIGATGLAVPLCMVNGLIADFLLWAWKRRGATGNAAPVPAGPTQRSLAFTTAATVLIALFVVIYGFARIDRSEPIPGPRLALVQPSLPHVIGSPLGVYVEELYQTIRHVPAGEVEMIIWPENAILDFSDRPNWYMEDMEWLARTKGAHVLFGGMGRSPTNPFRTTNSAMLLTNEGRLEGAYAKIEIIPWAEYFPFEAVLSQSIPSLNLLHMRVLLGTVGFFPTGTAGTEARLFEYSWQGEDLPFVVSICSESSMPSRVREGVRLGARFLVNIISEGEVGGLVQIDMKRLSQMRATEHRMPLIRVGNTGISCVIDESGRVTDVLRGWQTGALINEPGVLLTRLPLPKNPRSSLYTAVGDVIPVVCVALTALFVLAVLVMRLRGMRPAAALFAAVVLSAGLGTGGCASGSDGPHENNGPAPEFQTALSNGKRAFEKGRQGAAFQAFSQAVESDPGNPAPYGYIAEILRVSGRNFDGYEFFHSHREHIDEEPDLLAYLGYFQAEIHLKTEAVESFERVLRMDPANRIAMNYLAPLLLESNRAASLIDHLRRYLEKRPEDEGMQRRLGEALLSARRYEEAGGELLGALESDPGNSETLRLLGLIDLMEGRLDESEERLRASLRADGGRDNLEARYHLVRIHLRRGDMDAAQREIEALHAVEHSPAAD